MSETPFSPPPEARDPKFDITYDPEQLVRFESDHPEGPVVGFVPGDSDDVKLIVLEHTIVSHPRAIDESGKQKVFTLDEPLQLIYTPAEWVAFYAGVKAGEFDSPYSNSATMLRDSKAPKQHFFIFSHAGFGAFLEAINTGKYDLPEPQHTSVLAELTAAYNNAQNSQQ